MNASIFPYFHNLGHTVPALAVAEELRELGARVTFRGGGRYASLAERAGFTVRPAFTFSDEHNRRYELTLGQWTEEVVSRSIASELAAFDEDVPDVVVGDFRPTLAISTRLRGVPFAAISGAELTPDFVYPESLPRVRGFPARIVDASPPGGVPSLVRALFRLAGKHLKRAAERHGVALPGEGSLADAWTGQLTLLPDVPDLMPLASAAPDHYRYIGPVLRALPGSGVPPALDPERPLIYVSFGSTGADERLATVVDALAGHPAQVVLTTAGRFELTAPDNFIVTELADGCALTARAAVTVCAGGKGTVYQSLASGAPVVCLPRNINQWYISERVQRVGVGVHCTDSMSAVALRALVDRAMQDEHLRQNVAAVGEAIGTLSSQRRTGRLIAELAGFS